MPTACVPPVLTGRSDAIALAARAAGESVREYNRDDPGRLAFIFLIDWFDDLDVLDEPLAPVDGDRFTLADEIVSRDALRQVLAGELDVPYVFRHSRTTLSLPEELLDLVLDPYTPRLPVPVPAARTLVQGCGRTRPTGW